MTIAQCVVYEARSRPLISEATNLSEFERALLQLDLRVEGHIGQARALTMLLRERGPASSEALPLGHHHPVPCRGGLTHQHGRGHWTSKGGMMVTVYLRTGEQVELFTATAAEKSALAGPEGIICYGPTGAEVARFSGLDILGYAHRRLPFSLASGCAVAVRATNSKSREQ